MPDLYGSGDLTNQQKAAILFIAIGPEYSAKLFQHMDDDEIEQLTLEIANQKQVSSALKAEVISEFYSMCMAQDYISSGGLQYAQNVLEKALGPDKALEIINRLTTSLQVRPFDFLRKTDPAQLINFIQNEHPQTIALIMAYLEPDQAAIVLGALPPESQVEVTKRIATMDRTSPDSIREVERVLERKLSSMVTQDFTTAGGIKAIVEVLNRVDRTTEKAIVETLEVDSPSLPKRSKNSCSCSRTSSRSTTAPCSLFCVRSRPRISPSRSRRRRRKLQRKSTRICRRVRQICCARRSSSWARSRSATWRRHNRRLSPSSACSRTRARL